MIVGERKVHSAEGGDPLVPKLLGFSVTIVFIFDIRKVSDGAHFEHIVVCRKVTVHHEQQSSRCELPVGNLQFGTLPLDFLSQCFVALADTVELGFQGTVHHNKSLWHPIYSGIWRAFVPG